MIIFRALRKRKKTSFHLFLLSNFQGNSKKDFGEKKSSIFFFFLTGFFPLLTANQKAEESSGMAGLQTI